MARPQRPDQAPEQKLPTQVTDAEPAAEASSDEGAPAATDPAPAEAPEAPAPRHARKPQVVISDTPDEVLVAPKPYLSPGTLAEMEAGKRSISHR